MSRFVLSGTCFAALVCSGSLFAQGLSTINGSVSDSSGAVIAGARITVVEIDTGLARSTVSNSEGIYVLGSLRPSRYTMTAEAAGFSKFTESGITLQANDTTTFNVRLQVGGINEVVEVQAAAAQVDTSTPTLKQVVDSTRLVELPLNGRNAAQLTLLVAGAVNAPNNNSDQGTTKTMPGAVTVSVNGGRSNNIAFTLDGVHSEDIFSNVNQPLPMPDALQEFSFQTSNFSAEYGQNSSGVVNVVTKSGTNALHGDVFEFNRNAVFNARNFFAARRDQLKRNQFGGTLGGPVVIPRLYNGTNKTFFFLGYQGTRIRNTGLGKTAFIPTVEELNGDFSGVLNASDPRNPLGKATVVKDP